METGKLCITKDKIEETVAKIIEIQKAQPDNCMAQAFC